MDIDVIKIIEAWAATKSTTEERRRVAAARLEVCGGCEFSGKNLLRINVCKACGCPLKAKVFTKDFNDCPEKKWEKVDTELYLSANIKKEKSIL